MRVECQCNKLILVIMFEIEKCINISIYDVNIKEQLLTNPRCPRSNYIFSVCRRWNTILTSLDEATLMANLFRWSI